MTVDKQSNSNVVNISIGIRAGSIAVVKTRGQVDSATKTDGRLHAEVGDFVARAIIDVDLKDVARRLKVDTIVRMIAATRFAFCKQSVERRIV